MRRRIPELTDEDLRRLVELGGDLDQVAEAAGIDVAQVRLRLAGAARHRSVGRRRALVGDALGS